MSRRRTYTVACLSGHGIGPEVMAEASRTLAQISRLHGFNVDEVHPPFGGEAVTRSGHPLPAVTRRALLRCDAVLVAVSGPPALEGVKAELDLAASVSRTLAAGGRGVSVFAPLADETEEWTLEQAFRSARARTGALATVGVTPGWHERVARAAAGHDGVDVHHVPLAQAVHALVVDPGSLGVVVTERLLADALAEAPRLAPRDRLTAMGLLSPSGPGLYGPTHGSARDIAGQGVANPSGLLLAAALMLGEGLGRRSAADTLEEGLTAALARPERTSDRAGPGVAATTREFGDVVLDLLPSARSDHEFAIGGAA